MEFSVLGPLVVRADGQELDVGPPKRRALLTILLLEANRVVATERLADRLWDGDPPAAAPATIQGHVSRLRRVLGPDRLLTDGAGYRVVVEEGELDVTAFQADVAAAGEADLARALDRWRGAPLVDVADASWAGPEVARLEELRLAAEEALLEARLARGDHAAVGADAERLVEHHPLRERLWAVLITARYRDGRQADALRAYQDLRTRMVEELGIEPGEDLQRLEQAILAQDPSLATTSRSRPSGVVTFLLTDVVGSTALWERFAAAMAVALADHDRLIEEAVTDHHGTLLKTRGEGDATFSVFGRATDAVAAAADAQRRLAEHPWPDGAAITVRMALHTGEAQERDGDYYGRVVNRAARLRSVAGAGETLLSQSCAELVVDHLPEGVHLVELGPRQLKDLARPEVVYRLAVPAGEDRRGHEEPAAPPLPAALRVDDVLVGRSQERTALRAAWAASGGPRQQLAVVSGDPGIGKTALAGALAREAATEGALVLYGRCSETIDLPYQAFVEALRQHVAQTPTDVLPRRLGRLGPELVRVVPELHTVFGHPPGPDDDRQTQQQRFFDAVAGWLEAAAEAGPTVLVLDDLHWAGAPTVALLEHVLTADLPHRPLVVSTVRSEEVDPDHPAAQLLSRVDRLGPEVTHIALEGLDIRSVGQVVHSLAGPSERATDEFVTALQSDTAGNPLFVREVVRHLLDRGRLPSGTGDGDLPDTVREVIGRRVAALDPTARAVLETASVLGSEFDLDAVRSVHDEPADVVLDGLEAAVRSRLLHEVDGPLLQYRFAHALVRSTVLGGLTGTGRARLHARAAGWLRAAKGDTGSHLPRLATHAEAARGLLDPLDVARLLTAAGDWALGQLAGDEAIDWYERALPLTAGDGSSRLDVLLALGKAQRWSGQRGARATLLEAVELARQLDDPERMAVAALRLSRGSFSQIYRVDQDLVTALEAALAGLPAEDDPLRARVLGALAAELVFGDPERRRFALADEALAMARRLDDDATISEVLALRLNAIHTLEHQDERESESAELLRRAAANGSPAALVHACRNRRLVVVETPDLEEVDALLATLAGLIDQVYPPSVQHLIDQAGAWRAILEGRLDEAEQLALASFRGGQAIGNRDAGQYLGAQLVGIRRAQGRLDELVETATADETDFPAHWAYLARLRLDAGDEDGARARWPAIEAVPIDEMLGIGQLGGMALVCRAYLAFRFEAADDAARLVPWLEPHADRLFNPLEPQPVGHHFLGLLQATLGDSDAAEAHLERAVQAHRRLGAPILEAMTHTEWARVRRQAGDDPSRVEELVGQAVAGAQAVGAFGVVRDAEALLRADRPGADPAPAAPPAPP